MDRRRCPRVTAILPVHVWGLDAYSLPFAQSATVTDISSCGAVIRCSAASLRESRSAARMILRIARSNVISARPAPPVLSVPFAAIPSPRCWSQEFCFTLRGTTW